MTVFFTADTHFGQGAARGLFKRPFADKDEMDRALIDQWNEAVGHDDTVWHLGDVAVRQKPERIDELLALLNGHKHLIPGNNDGAYVREHRAWASVAEYREIDVDGTLVVLCHYALRTWRDQHKKSWNLHGHSHTRLKPLTRQQDVGVDAFPYRPVTFGEIEAGRRRGRGGNDVQPA